jgi:PAS domain S-box-containing protein
LKIEEVIHFQKIHARLASKNFQLLFSKWNNVLYHLSHSESIIQLDNTGKEDLAKMLGFLKNEIKGITCTDSLGRISYTIPQNPAIVGRDLSGQEHMKNLLTYHLPVISDVFTAVQGYQAIVIHYPVFHKGKYKGSIAFIIDFEKLAKDILEDVRIGESGTAWLISQHGVEIYCPVHNHIGKKIDASHADLKNIAHLMQQGKEGISSFIFKDNKPDNERFAYYLPIKINNTFWSLAITYSEKEITSSLISYRNWLLLIFVLVFMGGVFLSYYAIRAWIIINESELRKTAEKNLMKERTLLRTLVDNLPTGVFVKDVQYRKIISNPIHTAGVRSHLKQTGMNADVDILGKTDFELFSEEDAKKHFEDDRKVLEQGEVILNKIEPGWGPDNEKIWLLVSKVPIKAHDGSILGMVGITVDITAQKRIEEQLIIARDKAEQSDRLKTAFLNNISHEIRTPLNAIIGFSGLLNDADLPKEKKANYYQIICQSNEHLLAIITDIINIATIEAGQLKYSPGRLDINSTLKTLRERFIDPATYKGLKLSHTAGLPDDKAIIETDPSKVIEILTNLISNAIKFTEKGYIKYGYNLEGDYLTFFVEDTGVGIAPEHRDSVFERFWKGENTNYHYAGTGLGLSISRNYVELLGGKIWLTSELGSGSVFFFSIPYLT